MIAFNHPSILPASLYGGGMNRMVEGGLGGNGRR
jgi:hypothetical protein